MIELENELLSVRIAEEGAEMRAITHRQNGREYLWNGNPLYWKRCAPVLFPIVGSLWKKKYQINGKEYSLSQHGFARDMTFKLMSYTKNSTALRLTSDADTLEKFPFPFILEIQYYLENNKIHVTYTVHNSAKKTPLYFQIGAHPAFNYPDFNPKDNIHAYLHTDTDTLHYKLIGEEGCLNTAQTYSLQAEKHYFALDNKLFDKDALVMEGKQLHHVSLLDKEKKPYLSLDFDAPVFGLWSPAGKNAPFICLEPWMGRCDAIGFQKDFSEKDWINKLEGGKNMTFSYTIRIENA